MDTQLLLEISTVLSVLAIAVGGLASLGVFKSRRQREVEAKLKLAMRQHARTR